MPQIVHKKIKMKGCSDKTCYIWRAQWKNWICTTTMKLRKSLVKPVMRQKACNYIELFSSSARDRYAQRCI